VKHVGPAELDKLEPFLAQIRKLPGLKEKTRGNFYRGSRAFLHFHEHGGEFYADVRLAEDFERFPATRRLERTDLMKRMRFVLTDGTPRRDR
jgi:hypothetical protein